MTPEILIIVDVQKGFINRFTGHIPNLVENLQGDFDTVLASRFINPEGSMYRKLLDWNRFAPGSEDAELAFMPLDRITIYDKTGYTCLSGEISAEINRLNPAKVHLAGIATDNCILKTAVDLFEAGITPIIHAYACASHGGTEAHDCGIRLLKRFIGEGQVLEDAGLFRP